MDNASFSPNLRSACVLLAMCFFGLYGQAKSASAFEETWESLPLGPVEGDYHTSYVLCWYPGEVCIMMRKGYDFSGDKLWTYWHPPPEIVQDETKALQLGGYESCRHRWYTRIRIRSYRGNLWFGFKIKGSGKMSFRVETHDPFSVVAPEFSVTYSFNRDPNDPMPRRVIDMGGTSPSSYSVIDRNVTQDLTNIHSVDFLLPEYEDYEILELDFRTGVREPNRPDPWLRIDDIRLYYDEERPMAIFNYSPEKPMVGGIIELDASSSRDFDGEIVDYEWEFGDGQVVKRAGDGTIRIIYDEPDKYEVSLTVTDNDGQTASVTQSLDLTLQAGDIFLCRTPESGVPRFWSHAGMYIGEGQIIEAVKREDVQEVVISPLSDWSWPKKTCVEVLRVRLIGDDEWDAQIRAEAVSFAERQEGKPYRIRLVNKHETGDSWYCSELIWAAYHHATGGWIDIEHNPDPLAITPTEIDLDDDTYVVGEHREVVPYTNPIFGLQSPADLIVTDPDGLVISKQLNEIPGAVYGEDDPDNDGDPHDWVAVPYPKAGEYAIKVVPESNALPDETYSLEITVRDEALMLAEDVPVGAVPPRPYSIMINENPDLNHDRTVNFEDFRGFAEHWGETDCGEKGHWCIGADLDTSGAVDVADLAVLGEYWLTNEPLGRASDPNPANGATGVSRAADLSWTGGPGATSHDVYFGTSSSPAFIGNQTATRFDPGVLTAGTKYYWHIDEINASGKATGAGWSFTTSSGGGQ